LSIEWQPQPDGRGVRADPQLAHPKIEAVASAGTRPEGVLDELAVTVMKERAIDIGHHKSKGIDELDLYTYDYVVTMGCHPSDQVCPDLWTGVRLEWEFEEPRGGDIWVYRKVRDEIAARTARLVQRIHLQGRLFDW